MTKHKTVCTLCGKRPQDPKCPVLIIDGIDEANENVCKECYADVVADAAQRTEARKEEK